MNARAWSDNEDDSRDVVDALLDYAERQTADAEKSTRSPGFTMVSPVEFPGYATVRRIKSGGQGVVYEATKPSNILIDERGQPHVLDFGLAKLISPDSTLSQDAHGVTVTGQFVGSLPWATPEQVQGDRGRLILVLDEVDLLSDKDRHKDILYLLARSPNNYMAVLLSNHPKFMNKVDESIRSSLQPETVHFRNYDAHEILEILRDRAQVGLHHTPITALKEVAALTVRTTNSDVRVAIKTLYYIALEQSRDVNKVFNRARCDLVKDVLADLNDRNLMILRAAAETREPFVKDVYARYRRISHDEKEEPFSYVYFYSNLSYLQSIGLIMRVLPVSVREGI